MPRRANNTALSISIELAEQMFREAIEDNNPEEDRRTWHTILEQDVARLRERLANEKKLIIYLPLYPLYKSTKVQKVVKVV